MFVCIVVFLSLFHSIYSQDALNIGYSVIEEYPHDEQAFTQGFVCLSPDEVYESTGLYGQSTLRKVDLKTGNVIRSVNLANQYFGEGISVVNNDIYFLTWKERTVFLYDKNTFTAKPSFQNPRSEGWGLTYDETVNLLIMSDGTSNIFFIHPSNFSIAKTVPVTLNGNPLDNLNELEIVRGVLWANVWLTSSKFLRILIKSKDIVQIDRENGNVIGILDLDELYTSGDVLNGICYDKTSDKIYITGKLWPKIEPDTQGSSGLKYCLLLIFFIIALL